MGGRTEKGPVIDWLTGPEALSIAVRRGNTASELASVPFYQLIGQPARNAPIQAGYMSGTETNAKG